MRPPYPRGSPSLVNGAAFRSQSLSVRRFESCPPHCRAVARCWSHVRDVVYGGFTPPCIVGWSRDEMCKVKDFAINLKALIVFMVP
jgi:hypothetical protein